MGLLNSTELLARMAVDERVEVVSAFKVAHVLKVLYSGGSDDSRRPHTCSSTGSNHASSTKNLMSSLILSDMHQPGLKVTNKLHCLFVVLFNYLQRIILPSSSKGTRTISSSKTSLSSKTMKLSSSAGVWL